MYAAANISRDQFFSDKPENLSNHEWLFSNANPARLPRWFDRLIDLIQRRSSNAPRRRTFFFQEYLIEQIGKCERTVRQALRLLERLGVIATQRDRQNRHSIVASFFAPPAPPAKAPPPAPPAEAPLPAPPLLKNAARVAGVQAGINKDEDPIEESIISSHTHKDDSEQSSEDREIVKTFEQITGSTFELARDAATLRILRGQFSQQIIIAGMLLAAMRLKLARPGAQINSLAYFRSTITEIATSKITTGALYLKYLMERARKLLMLEKR